MSVCVCVCDGEIEREREREKKFVCVGEEEEENELFYPGANGNHCLSQSSCLVSVCCCGNAVVFKPQYHSPLTETETK